MTSVNRLIRWFTPEHYSLTLDIDATKKSFSGTVTIQGESMQADILRVHAKDLTITDVVVDGRSASYNLQDNDELEITQQNMNPGSHVVVMGFTGNITDQMHGMYPCVFWHDGVKKELIATQFESHHAREVFPCVDEPEAKATFDLTIITEEDITVLGNMPIVSQNTENGRLVTSFETSPRMSVYLLAWAYGELHSKSAKTDSGVDVSVFATVAQPVESLDFALSVATKTIDFFEDYFGVPYPLPKSDHIALPDFSSGAMENWGLVTYRESTLLVHPKHTSIAAKRMVAMVIGHELSHQWFGNLVTMRWWDDLWLNESFANLMEYIVVDALYPEWNIWLDYSSYETLLALRRDAIDGVQSVQVDVDHPDEITSLFDGAIVYAKGGRLIRMLRAYVGEDAFRTGLQTYFKKFAYKNTEGDDLWEELSAASGKDVKAFMHTWISQPGYPVIEVSENQLSQVQFFIGPHEQSERLWPIPLNASDETIPELLDEPKISASIPVGSRLNVGDTAHFISSYPASHFTAILDDLATGKLSPIDRLQFLHEQTMLARGGKLDSDKLIPLLSAYKDETVDSVWDIISLTIGELKKFVDKDTEPEIKLRELSKTIASNEFARLGLTPIQGEPETDTKLRGTVAAMMAYGKDESTLAALKDLYESHGIESLEPELRSLVLATMVRHYHTAELINLLVETYSSTTSVDLRGDICDALTSTDDPKTISRLHEMMLDTSVVRTQDTARWFVYLVRNRDARGATWQWMKDNWSWVEKNFSGDKSYDDYPRLAAAGLSSREHLTEYTEFFTPKMNIPALKRAIQLGISEIQARVELIEKDKAAVEKALLDL